jgi:hypothetical protein
MPASYSFCLLADRILIVLARYDTGKRVPATVVSITDAVRWGEEIMREIDERRPVVQERIIGMARNLRC